MNEIDDLIQLVIAISLNNIYLSKHLGGGIKHTPSGNLLCN